MPITQLLRRPGPRKVLAGVALLATAGSVAAVLAVGPGTSSATAMDGGVPDRRPVTARGEITAQYWHGVDRDPDAGGLANYMSFADKNCRWGVLDGSFKILNSGEARARWRSDPQTLAGMLYAALLNRAPDAGGLQAYTAAIRDRGLPWATAQMMGSAEYRARLNRICAGRNETATMYDWGSAQTVARDVFVAAAESAAKGCAFNSVFRSRLAALRKQPYPPAAALGRIAWLTNKLITIGRLDGTCGAVLTYLRAAYRVNEVIGGEQYNPVFIQWSVGSKGFNGQRSFTLRVGPDPTSWTGYSGKAW